MDKIIIKNIKVYGYHGVLKEETKLGQNFYIDIVAYKDLKKAGELDDLNESVSYADIYEVVEKIAKDEIFKLIEALGERIAGELLRLFPITQVDVQIRKPGAPIDGNFDWVGIEISRKK